MPWGARAALVCLGVALAPAPLRSAHAADELAFRFLDEAADGEYSLLCPLTIWGEGELRIAFDATEAGALSYLRLADGRATLYRVAQGVAEAVGEGQPFTAAGDVEVTLQRRAGRVRIIAGGEVITDVPWDGAPGGRMGVSSRGGFIPHEPLLQPTAPAFLADDFTREREEMADWVTHRGAFRNTMVQARGADPERSANPFSLRAEADAEALCTTGDWFWDSYQVSASVKPRGVEAIGLCGYVQDEANYIALRWRAGQDDEPKARQLVLVRDGQETVLAQAPGGWKPNEWYRLELRVVPGRVEALVDRDPALAAETTAFGQGGVGLWVRRGEAFFDDVLVAGPEYLDDIRTHEINPVFLADSTMASEEVFLPRGFWCPGSAEGEYWHWGAFFDDATVTVPLAWLQGDGLAVLLRSDATDTVGGYRVGAAVAGDSLTLDLARDGEPVASVAGPLHGDDPLLFAVRGDTVTVSQGPRALLSYSDPEPVFGNRVALLDASSGATDVVTVVADRFQDYVFHSSPTDWFTGKGNWEITTRWPCELGWTFFGGTGSENPVLWTKHSYRGDVVVEWFGALQGDGEGPVRYTHPSDINTTICGDGQSLSSGYSFVLGGWNNSRTAILRNGEIVAETSDVLLPNPNGRDMSFHRGWTRLRAEKLGGHVRFWYENQLILEYVDPDPLPEGRVALWSFHNELMVGRVRLWYAEEGPGSVVRAPEARVSELRPTERAPGAQGIHNDFEADCGEWQVLESAPGALLELDADTAAGGRQSLRVTNQQEGGPFAVYAVTTPFRISEWPVLSFDYRLAPEAKLNIYFLVNGQWHALKLTAEQFPWDRVPVIGEVPKVQADGQWHHAEFNLLNPLRQLHPQLSAFVARQVVLSPPWESYVRCGIGGNARGTQYWIDNFSIAPTR